MLDTFDLLTSNITFPKLHRNKLNTLQVNLGYLCNQQCTHCHVNAGPKRKEIMSKRIIGDVINFIKKNNITTLDMTGGAPEMNPYFKYLVENSAPYVDKIISRCNLTILAEPGYESYIDFLRTYNIEIVASLPCYTENNVDSQRGKGVFETSINIIKKLNVAGYGEEGGSLKLHFVYNPAGAFLPPEQSTLEMNYKKILAEEHGIIFNNLYTITNMPIKRFGSALRSKKLFDNYMGVLKSSFNTDSLKSVMCLDMLSVGWDGRLYDCDFNQMLGLGMLDQDNNPLKIGFATLDNIKKEIIVAEHCYGCTAGQGSSCGGALA